MLSSERQICIFKEDDETIFANKDEAIAYIEKVKEARELLENQPKRNLGLYV